MKKFYWIAISNEERVKSISDISDVISKYGTILVFQRYSDLSMGITIEIEEYKVNSLYDHLKSVIFIEGYEKLLSDSTNDCYILINITFTKGTGDLEIEVPAIIE